MVILNLMTRDELGLVGFTNIHPDREDESTLKGSITNLDWVAEDAEVTQLMAVDVIDFLQPQEIEDSILHWCGKLRHGGKIFIGGLDLTEAARLVHLRRINLDDANKLIFGTHSSPSDHRKSAMTMRTVEEILVQNGLKIQQSHFVKAQYCVEAMRP